LLEPLEPAELSSDIKRLPVPARFQSGSSLELCLTPSQFPRRPAGRGDEKPSDSAGLQPIGGEPGRAILGRPARRGIRLNAKYARFVELTPAPD
jgi:hypothetical protein